MILVLSYGSREEIIDGIHSLIRNVQAGHLDSGMIDADVFSKHLYTRYYPDPDLLIRTSGEMRISNFLLWQISYAEIAVPQKLWPDFQESDLFVTCTGIPEKESALWRRGILAEAALRSSLHRNPDASSRATLKFLPPC